MDKDGFSIINYLEIPNIYLSFVRDSEEQLRDE